MSGADRPPTWVYVGTYTDTPPWSRGRAEGIYVYRLDPDSGALTLDQTVGGVVNPSFLAIEPRGRFLYAAEEATATGDEPGGAVSAFARDPASGALRFLNRQLSHGDDPCYVSVDRSGHFVYAANYTSGSVAILPVGDDGRLEPASDVRRHQGSSVDPRRQAGPHAHSIVPDPTGGYVLAADLGLDQVLVYRPQPASGSLLPHAPPATSFPPGSGPRHLAFGPDAARAYVINELGSTLTACAWDGERGVLTPRQTVSTLPVGFAGGNHCADVRVAPSGRFVYGSNRGHDSIAIFAVDAATGTLIPAGHEPTQGRTPRGFAIDPTGAFLIAANQESDTIVTFRIDAETGQLTPTGQVAASPSPVCVTFVPA